MRVVTPEEMREIDARAIREFGLTEEILMERAGMAVSAVCRELFERMAERSVRRVLAVAGGGHNGADSLVALRDLVSRGYSGEALIAEDNQSRFSDALRREIDRLSKINVPVRLIGNVANLRHLLNHSSLIIDGILGTGFHGVLPESLVHLIEGINQAKITGIPVVSVDIPSGVDGLTGTVGMTAVKAVSTVTFGAPKWGLLVDPGTRFAGEIKISRIGFPPVLFEGGDRSCLTMEEALALLPKRSLKIHKGQAGHVLIAGGSPGKAGAILLAARGALRMGSGLVTILWDKSLADYSSTLPEVMAHFYDHSSPAKEDIRTAFVGKDAIGCGPGLPDDSAGRLMMETILSEFPGPVVADAGTFSVFSGTPERIAELRKSRPLVLTPHPGELGRLLGVDTEKVLAHLFDMATEAAERSGAVILLKGPRTLVVDPAGSRYVNLSGHPVMAGAGMGDVLTGMIVTLLGQGLSPFAASSLGAYIHGAAGERLGREGSRGRFSSELADALPGLVSEWGSTKKESGAADADPFVLLPCTPEGGEKADG